MQKKIKEYIEFYLLKKASFNPWWRVWVTKQPKILIFSLFNSFIFLQNIYGLKQCIKLFLIKSEKNC
jgi:hypothetical protein